MKSDVSNVLNIPKGQNRFSFARKALFYMLLLSLPFVVLEVLVRAYFATQVGLDVLLYGTMFSKQQQRFDPKGTSQRIALEETSVDYHENVTASYSKYYPYQKRNDKDEFGNSVDVTINGRGFRGRDFDLAKEPGVIRVVTLGASSTFGFRNHDDQTYPSVLEELLNRAKSKVNSQLQTPIKAFEVINLGVPHLRSEQIYSLLMNEALELQPDYVTFYEGINDAAWAPPSDTSIEQTRQAIKTLPGANQVFRELRYRLLSVALFSTLISERVNPFATKEDIESLRRGKREEFVRNLQRIYEACRKNNIEFIVVGQQATARESRKETREDIHGISYKMEQATAREKLEKTGRVLTLEAILMVHDELMESEYQWAKSNKIPYADVIHAMDANREYLITWVHLNAAGNRIVASVLAEEIIKHLRGNS